MRLKHRRVRSLRLLTRTLLLLLLLLAAVLAAAAPAAAAAAGERPLALAGALLAWRCAAAAGGGGGGEAGAATPGGCWAAGAAGAAAGSCAGGCRPSLDSRSACRLPSSVLMAATGWGGAAAADAAPAAWLPPSVLMRLWGGGCGALGVWRKWCGDAAQAALAGYAGALSPPRHGLLLVRVGDQDDCFHVLPLLGSNAASVFQAGAREGRRGAVRGSSRGMRVGTGVRCPAAPRSKDGDEGGTSGCGKADNKACFTSRAGTAQTPPAYQCNATAPNTMPAMLG
jgi:hypothetical protein